MVYKVFLKIMLKKTPFSLAQAKKYLYHIDRVLISHMWKLGYEMQ